MTRALAALACAAVLAGCSSDARQGTTGAGTTRADEFREVGQLVAAHAAKGRKAAPTPAELTGYEAAFPLAVKAIRSGEVVGVWGATLAGEGDVAAGKAATAVVAYEKKAETAGGWVILQNGEVKEMTAAEFAAAPKAGKK